MTVAPASTGNQISEATWAALLPRLRAACPRLSEQDLIECERRIDLLASKIQNRHWVDLISARRTVLALVAQANGAGPAK